MTAKQLRALVYKCGFVIRCKPSGPVLVKFRTDADMPPETLWLLKRHRDVFLEFERRDQDPTPRAEWETCKLCKAQVHQSLTPADAATICFERQKCPYMTGPWKYHLDMPDQSSEPCLDSEPAPTAEPPSDGCLTPAEERTHPYDPNPAHWDTSSSTPKDGPEEMELPT